MPFDTDRLRISLTKKLFTSYRVDIFWTEMLFDTDGLRISLTKKLFTSNGFDIFSRGFFKKILKKMKIF